MTIRYSAIIVFLFFTMTSFGQLEGKQVAVITKVNKDIEGLCDRTKVYSLYIMKVFPGSNATEGQISDVELLKLLNEKIVFLKENPTYKDKFSIRVIINCNGKLVSCEFENKPKNKDLNKQILDIFNTLDGWGPGEFNGEFVDSTKLYSLRIKNGEIIKY